MRIVQDSGITGQPDETSGDWPARRPALPARRPASGGTEALLYPEAGVEAVCPGGKPLCTFMIVPKSYASPGKYETFRINVVKDPATGRRNQYRGAVTMNPGGPGSSGVDFLLPGGVEFVSPDGLALHKAYDFVTERNRDQALLRDCATPDTTAGTTSWPRRTCSPRPTAYGTPKLRSQFRSMTPASTTWSSGQSKATSSPASRSGQTSTTTTSGRSAGSPSGTRTLARMTRRSSRWRGARPSVRSRSSTIAKPGSPDAERWARSSVVGAPRTLEEVPRHC